MASSPSLLDLLSRDEYLAVADRRARETAANVLRAANFQPADLVAELSGNRKELCRARDRADSGREKSALIARLAGAASPPPLFSSLAPATARASAAPTNARLTQADLERHLWSAADIRRGSIDSSDDKTFIFGLLFLKRLSDRFDQGCARAGPRADGDNPEAPDAHELFDRIVHPKARWPVARMQQLADLAPALSPREFMSGETFLYLGRQHRLRVEESAGGVEAVKLERGRLVVTVRAGAGPKRMRALLLRWMRGQAERRSPEVVRRWAARMGGRRRMCSCATRSGGGGCVIGRRPAVQLAGGAGGAAAGGVRDGA